MILSGDNVILSGDFVILSGDYVILSGDWNAVLDNNLDQDQGAAIDANT